MGFQLVAEIEDCLSPLVHEATNDRSSTGFPWSFSSIPSHPTRFAPVIRKRSIRADALSPPKPDWIRVRAPNTSGYADTRKIVKENGLVTVCEEAGCPNIGECWDKKHATFMIMGDTCTRACAFCNVKTGMPGALDAAEPEHVFKATFKLGLAHIVVTSVDRDDLADGGGGRFKQTIPRN